MLLDAPFQWAGESSGGACTINGDVLDLTIRFGNQTWTWQDLAAPGGGPPQLCIGPGDLPLTPGPLAGLRTAVLDSADGAWLDVGLPDFGNARLGSSTGVLAVGSAQASVREPCGNGQLDAGVPSGSYEEECDDANATSGDGCSHRCRVEPGYSCDGEPSACIATTSICGDGLIGADEDCDDGNAVSGDGCSACAVEPGFACSGEPSECSGPPGPNPAEGLVALERSETGRGVLGALLSGDGRSAAVIEGVRARNGRIKRVKSVVLTLPLEPDSWIEVQLNRRGLPKRIRDASGFSARFLRWNPRKGTVVVKVRTPDGSRVKERVHASALQFALGVELQAVLRAAKNGNGPRNIVDSKRLSEYQKLAAIVGFVTVGAAGTAAAAYSTAALITAGGVLVVSTPVALVAAAVLGGSLVLGADQTLQSITGTGPITSILEDRFEGSGVLAADLGAAQALVDVIGGTAASGPGAAASSAATLAQILYGTAVEHYESSLPECAATPPCAEGFEKSEPPCLCTEVACGNGRVEGTEQCDDANAAAGDGCSPVCIVEFCGDSFTQLGLDEECDDGNASSGDGCSAGCRLELCGDGVIQPSLAEQCDDGNMSAGDGCDTACLEEPGWSCQGEPSGCEPGACGNGVLDVGEGCDVPSGPTAAGCSSACEVQPGWCCSDTPGLASHCYASNDACLPGYIAPGGETQNDGYCGGISPPGGYSWCRGPFSPGPPSCEFLPPACGGGVCCCCHTPSS